MRGGQIVLVSALAIAERHHVRVPFDMTPKHHAFPEICFAIGLIGLYSQVGVGWGRQGGGGARAEGAFWLSVGGLLDYRVD